jgi:hypothetical protein
MKIVVVSIVLSIIVAGVVTFRLKSKISPSKSLPQSISSELLKNN